MKRGTSPQIPIKSRRALGNTLKTYIQVTGKSKRNG
jgi:hypothetical protein